MNAKLYADYKAARAQHPYTPAHRALRIAKAPMLPRLDWQPSRRGDGQTAKVTIDGYTVTLTCQYDSDADLSFYGEMSRDWCEGALDLRRYEGDRGPDGWPYFIPQYTEAMHYQDARDRGDSKGHARLVAHTYVKRDYGTFREYADGSRYMVEVTAKVHPAKVPSLTAGEASSWGIEGKQPYLDEQAWEVVHEAISEAEDNIAKLIQQDY